MPVFGIVPYRTEARTRSEARIQEAVDRLLLILKTVNEVIRTAEGRLIELFRPPPVLPQQHSFWDRDHTRAADRSRRITGYPPYVLWGAGWGREDYEEDRTTYHNLSWGTIQ